MTVTYNVYTVCIYFMQNHAQKILQFFALFTSLAQYYQWIKMKQHEWKTVVKAFICVLDGMLLFHIDLFRSFAD